MIKEDVSIAILTLMLVAFIYGIASSMSETTLRYEILIIFLAIIVMFAMFGLLLVYHHLNRHCVDFVEDLAV